MSEDRPIGYDAISMAPVPADHPLMVAWEAHKATPQYANSRHWASSPSNLEGSLWALFEAGFYAGCAATESHRLAEDLARLDAVPGPAEAEPTSAGIASRVAPSGGGLGASPLPGGEPTRCGVDPHSTTGRFPTPRTDTAGRPIPTPNGCRYADTAGRCPCHAPYGLTYDGDGSAVYPTPCDHCGEPPATCFCPPAAGAACRDPLHALLVRALAALDPETDAELVADIWFPKGKCIHCGKRPWAK